MTTALKVKNLCKTYIVNKRQNNVLRNVNFIVEDGELTAIMGPSGSGKTTLLYTVSGMDERTAGDVEFYGTEISKLDAKKLAQVRLNDMGFIFQQMYMLKNLTINDNILLPAYQALGSDKSSTKNPAQNPVKNKGKGISVKALKKEKDEYALELMRKLDIIDVAENDITEVSGGQLQRACICRSLINRPKMIFADEPTGSLNKQASYDVMEEIIKVNRGGTTVMLVTHDVRVAAKCDRVLYISDGNIHDEYQMEKYSAEQDLRVRERALNNWLIEKSW